jgi:hypothetical protein
MLAISLTDEQKRQLREALGSDFHGVKDRVPGRANPRGDLLGLDIGLEGGPQRMASEASFRRPTTAVPASIPATPAAG